MCAAQAEFVHNGIRLLGFSLAGEESYVVVPEMNLAFDVGRSPRDVIAVDNVLLTHGHMDHSAGLAYYFAQRMFVDAPPGHLYAPEPLIDPIRDMLRTWGRIDGHEPAAVLHPVSAGDTVELRRNLCFRAFRVNHPCRHERGVIHALGFSVLEVRKKLKEEYEGLSGPELVDLKKKGLEIDRRLELPLIAYCGDTAPGDFLDLEYVREARILLLECTFVEDEHRTRARAGKHVHLADLPAVVRGLKNERILLTHLSRRTALAEARKLVRRAIGDSEMDRVSFLMEHRRKSPRRSIASSVPEPKAD